MIMKWTTLLPLLAFFVSDAQCCFFPQEFQGMYIGQFALAPDPAPAPVVQATRYSEVNIMVDSIPVWGQCYRRTGNNVLLRDRTRTTDCYRCFRVSMRSANVLQIHTEGLDKCYINEEAAQATCPTAESINAKISKEIVLYKKPGQSDTLIQQVHCPINGRFKFTYTTGSSDQACQEPVSEISNCPYGFSLTAKYKQCTFADREVNFQCLGDWDGPNGDRYVALLDPSLFNSSGPRYRCAVYREEATSGKIRLTMSPDSTCTHDLNNSSSGYETMILTPVVPPSLPVRAEKSSCKFPDWAQGAWQQLNVNGDSLTYTDPHNFQTYTMRCLSQQASPSGTSDDNNSNNNSHQQPPPQDFNFLVYVRTQCGDETYNCMAMKYRGKLVMEFQIGQYPSVHYNSSLCGNPKQFENRAWITQGMLKSSKRSSCPISGDYTGFIPDATGLCAKLSSDCNNPEVMFYTVSNCQTKSEIYEEREYRCLGEWEEGDVMYTYTQRRDLHGYQCFVGKITDGEDVFIKEAGDNCVRGMDPLKFGMKMTKQGSCDPGAVADMPHPDPVDPTTTSGSKQRVNVPLSTPRTENIPTTTTKPWKPITAKPTDYENSGAQSSTVTTLLLSAFSLFVTLIFQLPCGRSIA